MPKKLINEIAPHQAVILVQSKIHEVLPTGQLSPTSVKTINTLFSVVGKNYKECETNVEKFIQRIKNNENKNE